MNTVTQKMKFRQSIIKYSEKFSRRSKRGKFSQYTAIDYYLLI